MKDYKDTDFTEKTIDNLGKFGIHPLNEQGFDLYISPDFYNYHYLKNSENDPVVRKQMKEKAKKEMEELSRKKREEAQSRMAEAKTRNELNLFTNWVCKNESFDLNKFQIKSNKFIEKLNSFKVKKDRLCNNISELSEPIFSDDGNFE